VSRRILVVDDAPSVTGVVQFVLDAEGYDAEIVGDGRVALEAIARRRPDLILLDLNVPGLDGYQVAERLQGSPETAGIPIILLTGTRETASSPRLTGYPIRDVVMKPFSPKELVARIRKALDG
jgi:two-component system OmpR family response regulator